MNEGKFSSSENNRTSLALPANSSISSTTISNSSSSFSSSSISESEAPSSSSARAPLPSDFYRDQMAHYKALYVQELQSKQTEQTQATLLQCELQRERAENQLRREQVSFLLKTVSRLLNPQISKGLESTERHRIREQLHQRGLDVHHPMQQSSNDQSVHVQEEQKESDPQRNLSDEQQPQIPLPTIVLDPGQNQLVFDLDLDALVVPGFCPLLSSRGCEQGFGNLYNMVTHLYHKHWDAIEEKGLTEQYKQFLNNPSSHSPWNTKNKKKRRRFK